MGKRKRNPFCRCFAAGFAVLAAGGPAYAADAGGHLGLEHKPKKQQSVESVYRQQNALFKPGQFIIQPGFSYAYSDSNAVTLNGFLALGAIFLGQINVSKVKSNIETLSLQTSYSPTDDMQFALTVPYLARQSTYESVGVNGSSLQASEQGVTNKGQIGDVSASFFYQLAGSQTGAALIWNLVAKAPTGRSPYGIPIATQPQNNNLSYPTALPTGNGVWSVQTGLSAIKTVNPVILFTSLSYTYEIPRDFGNISTTTTPTPGRVAPGNAVSVGGGTAFALNRRISLTFSFNESFIASTSIKPAGSSWQTVVGSSENAAVLNFGVSYAENASTTIVSNLGIGLTRDAPNVDLSFTVPMTF